MMNKILYGSIFCLLLPVAIVWGSCCLEPYVDFPIPCSPLLGWIITGGGAAIMLMAMAALKFQGGGLPMNGFPPLRFVTNGIYAVCPHPIYTGAVLACGGVAIGLQSRAGLYIFTPLLTIGCLAILWGYERLDLIRRFGSSAPVSWLGIPPAADTALPVVKRFAAGLFPAVIVSLTLKSILPMVILVPILLLQNTCRKMRYFTVRCLVLSILFLLIYFSFPQSAPIIVYLFGALIIAAGLLPSLGGLWLLRQIYVASEKLANSWSFRRVGPLRIINHALYSFLAAAVGFFLIQTLTGGRSVIPLIIIAICSLIGAGLWAQLIEGSSRLLRPFGFYGAIYGAIGGLILLGIYQLFVPGETSVWVLGGALAVSAPFTQAVGRLRCIVQGCCHGRPVSEAYRAYGICHNNPSSRVCLLTSYTAIPLHATALYSIATNLLTGWLLFILWRNHCPCGITIGLYLALTGCGRFVEEAYRGEPQTRFFMKLSEYQWLAISFVLGAFAVWSISAAMLPPPVMTWSFAYVPASILIGLIFAFAMSMDFPDSNRRFSRLTG